jgi:pyrroloquinoline quinone (PQQ) biosynthesis protein C
MDATMTDFALELIQQTDPARRAFENHPAVIDAVARGMTLERYRRFLLELYQVVWHFNPITAAAVSRLSDDYQTIRYSLYAHMHEEMGHERWVMNDLMAVGVPREAVLAHQPLPTTLAMVGYNYWAVERRHPCSVLGMLYTLEAVASVYGGPFVSAIKESLLLQEEVGVSFLSSHATLDEQHMNQLHQLLKLLRDDASRRAVIESTLVNFHQFTQIIEGV